MGSSHDGARRDQETLWSKFGQAAYSLNSLHLQGTVTEKYAVGKQGHFLCALPEYQRDNPAYFIKFFQEDDTGPIFRLHIKKGH